MKERTKVYLYTRVSTAMQIDGYSLEAQKNRMKAYAEFNDYEIAGEYEDAGKSGKSIEGRTEFSRMMDDIKCSKDHVSYNILSILMNFEKLYSVMSDIEKRDLMATMIADIQVYPQRQPNGQWLKSIHFKLPLIAEEELQFSLDKNDWLENVMVLEKK